jgi:hypothetical protein
MHPAGAKARRFLGFCGTTEQLGEKVDSGVEQA